MKVLIMLACISLSIWLLTVIVGFAIFVIECIQQKLYTRDYEKRYKKTKPKSNR